MCALSLKYDDDFKQFSITVLRVFNNINMIYTNKQKGLFCSVRLQ